MTLRKRVDEWLRQESEEGRTGVLVNGDYSVDQEEEDDITRRKMSRDELLAKTIHEQDERPSVSGTSIDEEGFEKRAQVDNREITISGEADSNVERAEMAEDSEEKIRHLTEVSQQQDDEEEEEDDDDDDDEGEGEGENDTDELGHRSTTQLDDDMTGDFETASYQDKEPGEVSDHEGEAEPISDNDETTAMEDDTFVTMDYDEDESTRSSTPR